MSECTPFTIRALTPDDGERYIELRQSMLRDDPPAFASSPSDDRGSNIDEVRGNLSREGWCSIGAFREERLVGVASLAREPRLKLRHRAWVYGVWVSPEARGQGVGETIMRRLIEKAASWDGVQVVCLSAGAEQGPAIRLYERLGFERWGVEPRMLLVDGVFYDEVYMNLWLPTGDV